MRCWSHSLAEAALSRKNALINSAHDVQELMRHSYTGITKYVSTERGGRRALHFNRGDYVSNKKGVV